MDAFGEIINIMLAFGLIVFGIVVVFVFIIGSAMGSVSRDERERALREENERLKKDLAERERRDTPGKE